MDSRSKYPLELLSLGLIISLYQWSIMGQLYELLLVLENNHATLGEFKKCNHLLIFKSHKNKILAEGMKERVPYR